MIESSGQLVDSFPDSSYLYGGRRAPFSGLHLFLWGQTFRCLAELALCAKTTRTCVLDPWLVSFPDPLSRSQTGVWKGQGAEMDFVKRFVSWDQLHVLKYVLVQ